ncbi:MAG: hypothetical protein WKG07_45735 [Hymenobacter sp.]
MGLVTDNVAGAAQYVYPDHQPGGRFQHHRPDKRVSTANISATSALTALLVNFGGAGGGEIAHDRRRQRLA